MPMINPASFAYGRPVARDIQAVVERLHAEMQAEDLKTGSLHVHRALRTCIEEVRRNVALFVRIDWDEAYRAAADKGDADAVEGEFCTRILRRLETYAATFAGLRSNLSKEGGNVTGAEAVHLRIAEIGTERMRRFSRSLLDGAIEAVAEHRPDALPPKAEVTPFRPR